MNERSHRPGKNVDGSRSSKRHVAALGAETNSVDPEPVDACEIGTKNRFQGNRLQVNVYGAFNDAKYTDFATAVGSPGIPLVFSAERRNHAKWRDGKFTLPEINWWPSEIGLAAVGDVAEYRAMRLRMTLGPQIDLATDPRWTRTMLPSAAARIW